MDADDYLAPSMYESIFKSIGSKDVDYVRLYNTRTSQRYNPDVFVNNDTKAICCKVVTREEYFINENVGGCTHSLFVKASIVKEHDLTFCKDMIMLEDQAFSISCATYTKNILVLEQPRNYFYFSGNESCITRNCKNTSDDIVRCVNIVYRAFIDTQSNDIISKYFYKKYLPIKLDSLCGNLLHYRDTKLADKFLPEIRISMKHLAWKAKVKYVVVKLLRLL